MEALNEAYNPEVIVDNLRPTTPEYIPDAIEETPIDPNLTILPDKEPLPPFVLGRVKGVFMGPFSVINGNGRIYLPEIMDAILSDPYIVQMMGNKCLLGEAHHPGDKRSSLWLDEAAISVTKLWKEGMYLMGEADILDTPNGRIVWTLVKYGSKLGVSARASGKGVKGSYRGQRAEIIKPENYELKGFDVVLNPGFPAARPDFNSTNEEAVVEEMSLHDELKSLITESKVDKDFVRGFINYSEDESLKDLLPMLEEDSTECSADTSDVDIREENEKLKEAYNNMTTLVDALRAECLENHSENVDGLIEELLSEVEHVTTKVGICEEQIEELTTLLEESGDRYAQLVEEKNSVETSLNEELDSVRSMWQASAENSVAFDTKCGELCEELETWKSKYISLSEELTSAKARIKELEESITEEEEEGFDVSFLQEEKTPNKTKPVHIPTKIDMSSSILSIVNEEIDEENRNRRSLISSVKGGKNNG